MDIDDFLGVCLIALIVTPLGAGVSHLFVDYRTFSEVVEECRKTGYLQDKATRIYCQEALKPAQGK